MPDDFHGYDLWRCQSPDDAGEPRPGTVASYSGHEQCLARIAKLTDLLEEIAAICDGRDDADMVGDPPRYVPNIWAEIHLRIREVVPR